MFDEVEPSNKSQKYTRALLGATRVTILNFISAGKQPPREFSQINVHAEQ